ncbi:MAG TPA: tetratricopeptide repeat protein [Candidatus Cloacimonadota bacterium]|nr:tetratricopeptide repeat protein [Candidatus Cloacimonadota bacterium]
MIFDYFKRFQEKYYQTRGQRMLSRGVKDKAYHYFQKALLLNANYINQYNMGLVLITMNKHEMALDYLEKVLNQYPDNEVILTTIAETYTILRKWNQATECYKKLSKEHPDFPLYQKNYKRIKSESEREKYVCSRELFFKGMDYQDNKSFNEAIKTFEEALALDPDNAMIYNTLGITMMKANRPKKDIESCFEKAVQLSPSNTGYKHNLAKIKTRKK